ncbi:hypothetical protein [Mucisphaera calidilacus]|uniref:Uncharacterized protein n=1 Tax=Mucisphaera calidilacus TaxID=2527982 RepID=A0A518BZ90_9BACT|nr:hypothetical protein [Mucisphaera calidilacus]QDU72288.1 hypothetical protein Pan265_21520 [Mucisphaera calidilacus]
MSAGDLAVRAEVRVDTEGRIDQDLPCAGCGYNLRMSSAEGVCAECGVGVRRSMQVWRLGQCDPLWLRRISAGFYWIAVGILVPLVLAFVVPRLVRSMSARDDYLAAALLGLPIAVLIVTLGLGVWRITSPSPVQSPTRLIGVTRCAGRWSCVASLGLLFMGINLFLVDVSLVWPAVLLSAVSSLIAVLMLVWLLERLASQVRTKRLLAVTRILMGYEIVFVLLASANYLLLVDYGSAEFIIGFAMHYIDPYVYAPPPWLAASLGLSMYGQPTGWSDIYAEFWWEYRDNWLTQAGVWPGVVGLVLLALMMFWYRRRFLDASRVAQGVVVDSDSSTEAQRAES